MHPIIQVAIVLGGTTLLFLVTVAVVSRRIDGPNRPIVVVDRRTYRRAQRRVLRAIADGEIARAHAGLTAMHLWLRRESQIGPKRRRASVRYAWEAEQCEHQAKQLGIRL